jgi:HEAT repeat protein
VVEHNGTRAAKRAITPIVLADSVNPSPDLLRIAKTRTVARETRKSAIFWVGQIGGGGTVQEIAELIRDPDQEVAKSALFAISQLRSDASARTLLSAARNKDLPTEVRKSAVFWLGQIASDQATEGLKEVMTDENTEVKKSAVFALSQQRTEQSLVALMQLARTSKDKELRKAAIFWLGQSNDPRVLAFFEEILLKKN